MEIDIFDILLIVVWNVLSAAFTFAVVGGQIRLDWQRSLEKSRMKKMR